MNAKLRREMEINALLRGLERLWLQTPRESLGAVLEELLCTNGLFLGSVGDEELERAVREALGLRGDMGLLPPTHENGKHGPHQHAYRAEDDD